MLWRKESSESTAMNVDIFKSIGQDDAFKLLYDDARCKNTSSIEKSDDHALAKRMGGNADFKNRNWHAAIFAYNESLRYAKEGSTNVSLAYANRSNCFLNMKMYHECLIDIRLAKDANYPMNLLPKLETRETECLKQIENGAQQDEFGLKPHEKFPFMANVMNIKSL